MRQDQLLPNTNASLFIMSPLLLLLFISPITAILYCLYLRHRTRQQLSSKNCNLPTVSWLPKFITYNPTDQTKLPSSNITNILPRMERLKGPYGMYATVYGISTKVIHIAHPIPAKAVLTGVTNSTSNTKRQSIAESLGAIKRPAYNHFKNFSGDGVFTADGSIWKAKRASVLHCLLKNCTKEDSPESKRLESEANFAAETFLKNVLKREKDVNVVPILQQATIGLIYRFITHDENFSLLESNKNDATTWKKDEVIVDDVSDDSDSCASRTPELTHSMQSIDQTVQEESYPKPQTNTHQKTTLAAYLDAITNIRMIILAQSRSIWFLLPRWTYKMFSSLNKKKFRSSHNPSQSKLVEAGKEINQELLDEAITLLFAGQDTSAATLSWTLHLLSLYPNIQSKLRKEVESVLAEANIPKGQRIPKKLVPKFSYMDAVIKESMRLYPVAPFVVRKLPDDLTMEREDKTSMTLPKDTFACVWIYGLHRNPNLWHRPNDFVPERWIDPELQKLDEGQTTYRGNTFMPFAAGPRNCVGQPLAQTILRIMLSRIINEIEVIDLQMTDANDVYEESKTEMERAQILRKDMQAGFTVLPSGGVKLLVREANASKVQ
ncbi:hypothetical protein CTEN210_11708 [Chaetoceros tenuissimus]|uniref:Cytochrome P450 n=1 Tax=Chaetoceros tenuissimus TaxID=426638 RepID=A0AAD3H955_9STRA|nr:hypothetical protein CTEN210_11708 [Chaetoceros tenuissimus]